MRILQISTYDRGGGAEAVAWELFSAYRRRGHLSEMAVGDKRTGDPDVTTFPLDERRWPVRLSRRLSPYEGRIRGAWRLRRWLERYAAHPPTWVQSRLGREHFNFPETWRLFQRMGDQPDVVHCHNLHGGWLERGGYFDLRALPWLSRRVPTMLTLHDTWLLSGHCAYTLGCDRWKTGCGRCPDLSIYPALTRDGTAHNWKVKQSIYADSRLYIATPSRWMMRQVEQSMLAPAVVEARVIPNGVDANVFRPGEKGEARASLGLPQDAAVLLFVANAAKQNVFKDYKTVEACTRRVAARFRTRKVLLLVLGQADETLVFDNGEIQCVPFQTQRAVTARFYQAADVYVHAAKSDTFPNTILEALSCGTPVVATAVDGIPEQVEEGRSGFLVPAGDADSMAAHVCRLLSTESLRAAIGRAAAERASRLFGLDKQVDAYLGWYGEMTASRRTEKELAHAC